MNRDNAESPSRRIGVSMGDPAGVGPELCLRLLADPPGDLTPIVFGDACILREVASATGLPPASCVHPVHPSQWIDATVPTVVDLGHLREAVHPGVVAASAGAAAYAYLNAAIDAALAGHVAGIATAPINKEALHAAGIHYPGHTEILAERTESPFVCMLMTSALISVCLVTTHVGYAEVPDLLTVERIVNSTQLGWEAMRRLRGRDVKVVMCGLNPHAGEHGLFGDGEEERLLVPAIQQLRSLGVDIEGPLPPDTAFLPWRRESTDLYTCMYHDQGLIPLKAIAFDQAVNVTLGLPIVRTSVDHGTAFDIAWQGKADVSSLMHAVRLAGVLAAS